MAASAASDVSVLTIILASGSQCMSMGTEVNALFRPLNVRLQLSDQFYGTSFHVRWVKVSVISEYVIHLHDTVTL